MLSLDSSACARLATENRPSKVCTREVPRVNLRKRPSPPTSTANDFTIPHVTTDFLSSLFSEVKNGSSKRNSGAIVEAPSKKMRKSFKSFTNLTPVGLESFSPVTTNTAFFDKDYRGNSKNHITIVSSSSGTTEPLFPNLPVTVSASSSCSRTNLSFPTDQQSSVADTRTFDDEDKDTYGWFVVVDNDDLLDKPEQQANDPDARKDLAFRAPTAPKAPVHDDVKWAQAADTVDDVLADFF